MSRQSLLQVAGRRRLQSRVNSVQGHGPDGNGRGLTDSNPMARATVNDGIEVEYDTFGDPTDPTLLLVCGFTSQMISWRPELCRAASPTGACTSCATTTATVACPPNRRDGPTPAP